MIGFDVSAEQSGEPVCGRFDPAAAREYTDIHGGTGTLTVTEMLKADIFSSDLVYFHRGEIPPGSSIGEHMHRTMEEMYFVFNAPAEYTVNGHTSLLPAGVNVRCALGSSHGIYNPGSETLQFLNIGVTMPGMKPQAIDFGEDLSQTNLENPPDFQWAQFDRTLLKPVTGAHGGKGDVLFRRLWGNESFKTNWFWIDHCLLKPGTSIGYHQHNGIEEVYYVLSGSGLMTVNDVTWEIHPDEAAPCTLHDSHGIYNHTGGDLEIFVLAVAMEKGKTDVNNWGDDLSGRKVTK